MILSEVISSDSSGGKTVSVLIKMEGAIRFMAGYLSAMKRNTIW